MAAIAVVGLPLVETYELLSNFNSLREGRDNYDG
jgi:septum formation protein